MAVRKPWRYIKRYWIEPGRKSTLENEPFEKCYMAELDCGHVEEISYWSTDPDNRRHLCDSCLREGKTESSAS